MTMRSVSVSPTENGPVGRLTLALMLTAPTRDHTHETAMRMRSRYARRMERSKTGGYGVDEFGADHEDDGKEHPVTDKPIEDCAQKAASLFRGGDPSPKPCY